MEEMKCFVCNNPLEKFIESNIVNHYTDTGIIDKTVIIENIPMLRCSNLECPEEYFEENVAEVQAEILKKVSNMEGRYFVSDFNTKEVFVLEKK